MVQSEILTYDANDNVLTHTDFNGRTLTYDYDSSNRQIAKHVNGGVTTTFAYTAAGLRTAAGADTAIYDAGGRLIQQSRSNGVVVSYTYDAAGNRTSVTTPHATATFTYDALNRLSTVSDATGVIRYTYDLVGNLATTHYPNGITTRYTYDSLNRLVRLVTDGPAGTIASYSYALDAAGRRVRVEENVGGRQRTVNYTYDMVSRLTREVIDEPGTGADLDLTYAYDAVGNRQRQTSVSAAGIIETAYSYDENDRLLTEATTSIPVAGAATMVTTTSSYDDNGSLLSRRTGGRTDTYTYDAERRLIAALVQSGPAQTQIAYTYDADGMRTSMTVNGATTTFVLATFDGLTEVLAEVSGANVTTYTRGHDLIGQTRAGIGTRFYHFDGRHSTRQLSDVAGAITDSYAYDAFGNVLSASGSTPNTFLDRGQQLDPNLGFYYLRARYYAPTTGRFLTTDPLDGFSFDPPSLHRYLYAKSDPVNQWDPTGEQSLIDTMQSIAIQGALLTLRFVRPALNVIFVGGKALGTSLVQRFVLRFAMRLGPREVARILIKTGIKPRLAQKAALEATSPLLDPIKQVAVQLILRGETNLTRSLFGVLFALFAGDQALAHDEARAMTPKNDVERVEVASLAVFMEDERPTVAPRFRAVFDGLYELLQGLF
jgi:RHS repeat-associated protein